MELLNEYARKRKGELYPDQSPMIIEVLQKPNKNKPTQYQNAKNIYEYLFDTYIHKSGDLDGKPEDFDEIPNLPKLVFSETTKYLRNNKVFCGRFKLIEYAEAVMLMTGSEFYEESCFKGFEKRFT